MIAYILINKNTGFVLFSWVGNQRLFIKNPILGKIYAVRANDYNIKCFPEADAKSVYNANREIIYRVKILSDFKESQQPSYLIYKCNKIKILNKI